MNTKNLLNANVLLMLKGSNIVEQSNILVSIRETKFGGLYIKAVDLKQYAHCPQATKSERRLPAGHSQLRRENAIRRCFNEAISNRQIEECRGSVCEMSERIDPSDEAIDAFELAGNEIVFSDMSRDECAATKQWLGAL